jgi:hypothetical protein
MIRSLITVALGVTLALSLVYSSAIRHGHADAPIAATAEQVQPLEAGDLAPRFIVETVQSRAFDFDPLNLDRPVMIRTCGTWFLKFRNWVSMCYS